jgi:hypothetical protein
MKLDILNDINEIELLEDNWDGYGAIKVNIEILNTLKLFINSLDEKHLENVYDIYPNPNGTISIEFTFIKIYMLSIEIGETTFSYFIKSEGICIHSSDFIENIELLKLKDIIETLK